MSRYRILSFDSGGIRGLLSVLLLEELDRKVPGWRDNVDLITGASTGGIIALGLAKGVELSRIKEFYYSKSEMIFKKSYVRELSNFIEADYDNEHLKKVIYGIFKDTFLKDLGCRVIIPAFDLDNEHSDPERRKWKPKFFHNFPGKDSDGIMKAADVAMYTTAAPVIFPSVDGFIDGCVIAVNPSMSAIAQTQDPRNEERTPSMSDIVLLSVGTGTVLSRIEGDRLDWGYTQWIKPLMRIMFDGATEVTHYQCRQFLRERYHRIDHRFKHDDWISVDDHEKTDRIFKIAKEHMSGKIGKAVKWITDYWL